MKLRNCKITWKGHFENRPAIFHGWFQYGDQEGYEAGGVVEFDNGECEWYSVSQIAFYNPPAEES